MINRQALLADLQKFLQRIEADLLERSESTEVPEVPAALHAEYERAAKADRTAQNYEDWRTDTITQAAAAWVLSCVFVRFLEDNSLIDPPKIAGPGERLARARDEHELYFRSHPQHTDREYLLSIFAELAKLPGTKDIFGEHNAINDLPNWLSGDAAGELLNFFQKIDASTGELVHDFTDPNWDTRFLGDLYQDLSEAARKKFALLQTPDFVEEFILDRTLEPALEEFGLVPQQSPSDAQAPTIFKMIDPACGSGHFLLGAFPRLLDRWQRKEPATNIRELTQRALDSIHGVDINPFAVAIAKFRLLLAAMKVCEEKKLHKGLPHFQINIACGDSLLHGENRTSTGQKLWDYAEGATDEESYAHAYPGEDLQTVRTLLRPGTYHSVVANPPYIVPKDRKLNEWYRKRFSACHMKYSLAVPFMQQIFQLAVPNGFTGQITADSFMKREFGKKLIETFFPLIELTHVIDSKGAFIPGHATPTVIVLGRQRPPVASTIRVAMGIRGEPSTPENPALGLVWTAITKQIELPGSHSDFLSVVDAPRSLFHKHPWSIGGGGASELKERLEVAASTNLSSIADEIGIIGMTNADEVMLAPRDAFARKRVEAFAVRSLAVGDQVRDWEISDGDCALFPYRDGELIPLSSMSGFERWMWPCRTVLGNRATFAGLTYIQENRPWWEWHQITLKRLETPLAIVFGEIATHNHFVLDRNGLVFKQSAPVIKLPRGSSEGDHFALLGYLNSSTACFWMKQVAHQKQMMGGEGVRIEAKSKVPYAFSGTQVSKLPIPSRWNSSQLRERLGSLARRMDEVVRTRVSGAPIRVLETIGQSPDSVRTLLDRAEDNSHHLRSEMILLQEEMDFTVYALNSLVDENLLSPNLDWPEVLIGPGERPFNIFHGGNEEGFAVPAGIPHDWPEELRDVWQRRLNAISQSAELQLIEDSHYKRRWIGQQGKYNLKRNEGGREVACVNFLLKRLESVFDFDSRMTNSTQLVNDTNKGAASFSTIEEGTVVSIAQLSDMVRQDSRFLMIGELYRNDPAFDVQALVEELVLAESVPHLPILRYKDSGLRKRAEWEKTWDLQRREDAGESVGTIPVPPKYTSADFISTGGARYWSLRGKLDVPKERWISFPHCEGPDGTLVICWGGYDHLQQAQAISAYYVRVQTEFGGSDDPRLIPLLASLIELLPWLKQWHNEPNANFDGLRMGDYFEGFVNEEARNLGKTLAEIKAWVPPKKVAKATKPKKTNKKAAKASADDGEAELLD